MNLLKIFLVLQLAFPFIAKAQEEAVPSFETVVEDVLFNTSNRVIIDEKAIKESKAPSITSLLSTQANIDVSNSVFEPSSIFIRGGDFKHVLVLVDGVPFYDASTRTFNLNSLDVKSVRRIEILKGSQTVLYGGQALSGVIKIETIPAELKTSTVFAGQLGTLNMRDISGMHIERIDENKAAILRAQGSWKDAMSPVLDSSQVYPQNSVNTEAAYLWGGDIEGNIKAIYIQEYNYLPYSNKATYQLADTEDFTQYNRNAGFSSSIKLNKVFWQPRLTLSNQNSIKNYYQPLDPMAGIPTDENYGSSLRTFRIDSVPYKDEHLAIVAGLSYIYEDMVFRNGGLEAANLLAEQRGLFTKADYSISDNLLLTAGGRLENWSDNDLVGTYQAGFTAYKNTKFEISTGYKIPSLFQLRSRYGNPDLKEEKAIQYNLSQDIVINQSQSLSVTVFNSHFSNLIVVKRNGTLKYTNINKAEIRGLELIYSALLGNDSSLYLSYGYQEPRDLDNNRWLVRRSLVNGSIKYVQHLGAMTGSFEVVGVGEKIDNTSPSTFKSLPGYVTANASFSQNINENLTGYLRLNNLLNHRNEESFSYFGEGFTASIGGEYWF